MKTKTAAVRFTWGGGQIRVSGEPDHVAAARRALALEEAMQAYEDDPEGVLGPELLRQVVALAQINGLRIANGLYPVGHPDEVEPETWQTALEETEAIYQVALGIMTAMRIVALQRDAAQNALGIIALAFYGPCSQTEFREVVGSVLEQHQADPNASPANPLAGEEPAVAAKS